MLKVSYCDRYLSVVIFFGGLIILSIRVRGLQCNLDNYFIVLKDGTVQT